MNKVLTVVKNSLPILILLAGSLHAQPLGLADVIKRSAREIEEALPQGAKVAILNFNSQSAAFSDYAIDELTGELIDGRKITVVDRSNIEHLMKEMEFQMSGHVNDESMQKIGRMLGAQAMVTGALTDMGTHHRFRVRLINLETAAIQMQTTLELRRDDKQVAFLLGGERAIVAESVPNVTAKDRQKGYWYLTPRLVGIHFTTFGRYEANGWLSTAEVGYTYRNGFTLGVDGGIGASPTVGATFNIGGTFGTGNWQFAYGGSVGWWVTEASIFDDYPGYEMYYTTIAYSLFGPFIRLRCHNVEISYRLLFGPYYKSQLTLGYHIKFGKK